MIETVAEQPRQLVCNFRAPSLKEYGEWQEFKRYIKSQGLDICRVTIGLANAFMAGAKGSSAVQNQSMTVNIQMNNQFLYQVHKPRREPYSLDCVKSEFRRTIGSVLFEAYVLNKARELTREFSYRDFLELRHDAFRRIILRLKRKGKIMANPQRTVPRFYFLAERIHDSNHDKRTTQ
jgi:hypothetical protein